MATKVKDLAVKVSEYVDNTTGQTKGRFENIGAVLRGDDGGEFLMLNRTFNPAGVPNPRGQDSVLIGMFDPKPRDGQQRQAPKNNGQANSQANSQGYAQQSRGGQEQPPLPGDDDVPF